MTTSPGAADGSSVWLDLTDLSEWTGRLTGIQRVTYNLARSFSGAAPPARFFAYDAHNAHFRRRDFSEVRSRLQRSARIEPMRRELRALASASRGAWGSVRRFLRNVSTGRDGGFVPFGTGDTVVVPGNYWRTPSLLPALRLAKLRRGFRLYHLVYDLMPVDSPHLFGPRVSRGYERTLAIAVTISDGLFSISDSSKRDLERFCERRGIRSPPIDVIRLGDDLEPGLVPARPSAGVEPLGFILAVGTLEFRKNHLLLYYAYKEGLRRGVNLPPLVVAGRAGGSAHEVEHLFRTDPELRSRVVILSSASDAELAWLYRNCLFAVFPSLCEGFGLPIVEALRQGKLCLCSDASAMPEVGGSLAEYFSPYDSLGCLRLIERYLDRPSLEQKERQIRADYRPHAWHDTYREIARLLGSPP